jgi:hypothetical protein
MSEKTTFKEVKEKLKKEINQIDEKIKLKNIQIDNSPEYKLIKITREDLSEKRWGMEKELKDLKEPTYLKYVHKTGWRYSLKVKDIKSSVKQGIKKGLGITNVSFINEYDLMKIIQRLIDTDLEKIIPQIDKLQSGIRDIDTKIDKSYDETNRLRRNGVNALKNQRKIVYEKLHGKEYLQSEKR